MSWGAVEGKPQPTFPLLTSSQREKLLVVAVVVVVETDGEVREKTEFRAASISATPSAFRA